MKGWKGFLKKKQDPPKEKPLSAQLNNPYRPIYGAERRLEQLVQKPLKEEKNEQ